jgi:hypothetical protein
MVLAFVIDPAPLCVQLMVPFAAEAPLTVTDPFSQLTAEPPAVATGIELTITE